MKKVLGIKVTVLVVVFAYCMVQTFSIGKRMNKPEKLEGESRAIVAANYAGEMAYKSNMDKAHLFGVLGFIALALAVKDAAEFMGIDCRKEKTHYFCF